MPPPLGFSARISKRIKHQHRVYVRGLSGSLKLWQGSGWFCMRLHFFIKASFIIDTKGLYCVTKGNISFSSLLFCLRSAAFLL